MYSKTGDAFSRNMKITAITYIIYAMLMASALFAGQANDPGLVTVILITIIQSAILTPPTVVFMASFKMAGEIEEQYRMERAHDDAPRWTSDINSKQGTNSRKVISADEMDHLSAESAKVGALSGMDVTVGTVTQGDLMQMNENSASTREINGTKASVRKLGSSGAFDYPFAGAVYACAVLFMVFCSFILILIGLTMTGKTTTSWLIVAFSQMGYDFFCQEPLKIVGKAVLAGLLVASATAAGGLNDMLGFDD